MLEKRQQQIRELRSKHERLKVELEEAKSRLMLPPSKWSGECEYSPVCSVKDRVWPLKSPEHKVKLMEFKINLKMLKRKMSNSVLTI